MGRLDRLVRVRFGDVLIGFFGAVPPMRGDTELMPYLTAEGKPDAKLFVYQDASIRIAVDAVKVYEDVLYRVYRKGTRIWAECSSHGELDTWAYAILHFNMEKPDRIWFQVLPKNCPYFLDRILSSAMMESILLRHQHAVLHASVIDVDGQAILFSAPSQVGKSTQAELWRRHRGAKVCNGDRAMISDRDGQMIVRGIPYSGISRINEIFELPIRGIIFLRQGQIDSAEPLNYLQSTKALFQQISLQPWNENDISNALTMAQKIAAKLPCYRLTCTPTVKAVECLEQII